MGRKEKAFGLKLNPAKFHLEAEPDRNKLTFLLSGTQDEPKKRRDLGVWNIRRRDERKSPSRRIFLLSTECSCTVLSGSHYPPSVVLDWIEMGQLTKLML